MAEEVIIEQLTARIPFSTPEEWRDVRARCDSMGVDGLWQWVATNSLDHGWPPRTAQAWSDAAFLSHQHPSTDELIAAIDQWLGDKSR